MEDPKLCLENLRDIYSLDFDDKSVESAVEDVTKKPSWRGMVQINDGRSLTCQNYAYNMLMSEESRSDCEDICQRMEVPLLFGSERLPGDVMAAASTLSKAGAEAKDQM